MEIMIVVTIIGLLAAIAIPAFRRVQMRSMASRYANDFRAFSDAFQIHVMQNGVWPQATAGIGLLPPDMPTGLPAAWQAPTPMSGGYTWSGSSGRIRLLSSNATDEVMQRVDEILDDGDLSSGEFRRMGSGGYHYQLH